MCLAKCCSPLRGRGLCHSRAGVGSLCTVELRLASKRNCASYLWETLAWCHSPSPCALRGLLCTAGLETTRTSRHSHFERFLRVRPGLGTAGEGGRQQVSFTIGRKTHWLVFVFERNYLYHRGSEPKDYTYNRSLRTSCTKELQNQPDWQKTTRR